MSAAQFVQDLREGKEEVEILLEPGEDLPEDQLSLFFRELAGNATAKEVRITGVRFTEALATDLREAITRNAHLEVLSVATCGITAQMVAIIGGGVTYNRTLQRLNLSNNPLGNDGVRAVLRALEPNFTLELISLYGTLLTDAIAEDLAHFVMQNRGLRRLHIGNNLLGDTTCVHLARALEYNNTIEKIGFMQDPITDAGAVALVHMLRRNCTVDQIWLDSTVSEPIHRDVKLLTAAIPLRLAWEQMVALLESRSPRCGGSSAIGCLPTEIFKRVAKMMYSSRALLAEAERVAFPPENEDEAIVDDDEEPHQ